MLLGSKRCCCAYCQSHVSRFPFRVTKDPQREYVNHWLRGERKVQVQTKLNFGSKVKEAIRSQESFSQYQKKLWNRLKGQKNAVLCWTILGLVFKRELQGSWFNGHFAKPYHEPGRMNPARERVMAREANPWGTMWVGMSTLHSVKRTSILLPKTSIPKGLYPGARGARVPWVSTKKMWFMYMVKALCWEQITLICLLYMLIRFIYGYSKQQLYFAIWFSSSFLLDLHPWTPGGFCCLWLTGRWGRDKGKGKGYSSGQKRPGDFCVNKLCHFSVQNSRGNDPRSWYGGGYDDPMEETLRGA